MFEVSCVNLRIDVAMNTKELLTKYKAFFVVLDWLSFFV